MKKHLLTAAALVAAGAGHAQSSVTMYGVVDAGVFRQNSSAAGYSTTIPGQSTNQGSFTRYQDGGLGASNIGFKGSESLGGDFKANFQLQGNVSSATGATSANSGAMVTGAPVGAFFNQIAVVGLSGAFGEIKIGRQVTPMYYAIASTDAREGRYFGSILTALVGVNSAAGWAGTTTNAPLGAIYDDNTIVYTSPKVAGFTANLQYTLGEVAGNASAGNRQSATLLYDANNLKLSAAYYAARDAYTLVSNANGTLNNRFTHLGGMYTLGNLSLDLGWSNAKNPSNQRSGLGAISVASPAAQQLGSAAGNANYDIVSAGAAYRIAPQYKLTAGYYRITDKNTSANKSSLLAVGLDVYLSKRSMLYVQAARVDNQGNMNQGIAYGRPVGAGIVTTGYMVGMRHAF